MKKSVLRRIGIRRRGFTAVEIAMVATIIAIIALLILPVFRNRTEEARKAAVQDELQSLVKAILLVEADLDGFQPRLQDLDNVQDTASGSVNPSQADTTPPYAGWNYTVGFNPGGGAGIDNRTTKIVPNWRGPYIAARKVSTVQSILQLATADANFANILYPEGPIYVVGLNVNSPQYNGVSDDAVDDRYPIDPWGNPYLFFGYGRLTNNVVHASETNFQSRVVYSMGPNGLPGDGTQPNNYRRKGENFGGANTFGILGTGDDYEYIF